MLGKGAEADRHKRLRDLAAKNIAEDKKALAADEAQPVSRKDGKTLFNDGFNFVLHGKLAPGLTMIEKGIRDSSGLRRPEHAKLQMAYAYHLAGQNPKAIQIYKTIQGNDGAAALARLCVIHLGRSG